MTLQEIDYTSDFYHIIVVMLSMLISLLAFGLFYLLMSFAREKKSADGFISVLKSESQTGIEANRILTDKVKMASEMEDDCKTTNIKIGNEIYGLNYSLFKLLEKNNLLNK